MNRVRTIGFHGYLAAALGMIDLIAILVIITLAVNK